MGSGPFLIHSATNNIIMFNGVSVFTIGRNGGCNLDIAAIYISRKQCRIENLRNVGWVLFDESRFKTTKLNNESVGANYATLKDGDKISFSPNSGSHEYFFHCDEISLNRKRRRLDNELTQLDQDIKINQHDILPENERLSPLDLLREMATQSSFSLLSPKKSQSEELEKLKREKSMLELEIRRSRGHLESNSRAVSALQTKNEELLKKVEENEKKNKQLLDALSKLNESTQNDICTKKASLEDEVVDLRTKMVNMEQENIDLKDAVTDAEVEIDNLLKERCCKIIKFGADSKDQKNTSMDTLTEVEMSLMKDDLRELSKKNSELTLNLEKLTSEKEVFSVKVNEIIDSELYCSICSDLIYQAITLQCKHTFCKLCIEEWKKKKRDCPVCRTKIKTQVPCLIVDNFIDKVADAMGGEMKSRRQEIAKERAEVAAASKGTKRKRTNNLPPVSPNYRDLLDHLDIAYVPPTIMDDYVFMAPNFPDVVDLTHASPPPLLNYHRGQPRFERLGRRRYR